MLASTCHAAIGSLLALLAILYFAGLSEGAEWRAGVLWEALGMAAACTSSMMATDLADYLVRKHVSFREAHGAVGALVREAEEKARGMCERLLANPVIHHFEIEVHR